jgi:hypothetical protein
MEELDDKTEDYLTRIIIDEKKEGMIPSEKDEIKISVSLRSLLEGFIHMEEDGMFAENNIDFKELLKDNIDYFICGIQKYKGDKK